MNDVSKWIGDATVFGGDARAFCHPEKSPVHLKGAVPSVDVSSKGWLYLANCFFSRSRKIFSYLLLFRSNHL